MSLERIIGMLHVTMYRFEPRVLESRYIDPFSKLHKLMVIDIESGMIMCKSYEDMPIEYHYITLVKYYPVKLSHNISISYQPNTLYNRILYRALSPAMPIRSGMLLFSLFIALKVQVQEHLLPIALYCF